MKIAAAHRQQTQRAILDALAHSIVEAKGFGFSVQEVADRAGVTHRTVYNHFPTREALREGLATYVEEMFSTLGPPPDAKLSLEMFPSVVGDTYRGLETHEVHVRAYVILMVASRGTAAVTRARTRQFEGIVAREAALPIALSVRQVTAAVRIFASSMGWHMLTEHLGLSSEDAATTATWATQTLIDAVKPKPRAKRARKNVSKSAKGKPHATKHRRD